jgi:hypothetical protein
MSTDAQVISKTSSTRLKVPSKEELVEIIEASGSADADFFGYPVRRDGLYLQQDPEEFASFVHFMAAKVPPAKISLDIGIASGGQTKFLRDYWPSEKTIVVDIGQHPMFPHWERIKRGLNSELILELIGDSHAETTRSALLPFAGQIDFAFVDGDHSYKGLRQDIFLTKELLRVGGFMTLHDTSAAPDCKRVYDDLLASTDFKLYRNFPNRFGISVWKRVSAKKTPTWINRKFGWGSL